MRLLLIAALCVLASPGLAGVREAVESHALPGAAEFAEASERLAQAAEADCRAEALQPAFDDAFDAWLGLSHLNFGPLEEQGRALAIGFWPDSRGLVGRTVQQLIADEDPAARDPVQFAEVSIAGRGLFALERLLYDPALADYGRDDYACDLSRAMATDLSGMAAEIDLAWREGFAEQLVTAGSDGNARFLSEAEAAQALYTALATGLDFVAQQRLGRPMGEIDAPKPQVAEARRSGRPLRNVVLSLQALRDLARTLSDQPIPQTEAAFAEALSAAEALEDPVLAGVTDPAGRFKVEALQTQVGAVSRAATDEIGGPLGVSVGFNSADGD